MIARLTPLAERLPASVPFVGPEAQERAREATFAARLGANESVFGPSPLAVAAMAEAAAGVWRYGDPEAWDLRAAIAAHHRAPVANVMVGEGIDALLGNLVRLLVADGDPVVTSAGAYPTFGYHVAGFGGAVRAAPYRDDAEDPEALLAAVRETGARLVYLANPDNPMGSWRTAGEVAALVAGLPEGAVLCLDEAYADFAPAEAILPLDVREARVIRMRTFSKAYGMAGARVGYALGEAGLIAAFDRVRNPLRGEPDRAGGGAGGAGGSGVVGVCAGRGGGGEGADRGDRGGAGAAGAALGDELRHDRLRPGRGVRAGGGEGIDRAWGVRADAVRGAAGSLHPGHGGAGSGPRRL